MSWRTVVIQSRCKLDLKLGFMVVRSEDIKRICLDEISVIIIENTAVSVTSCLLNELMKRKIKVIFCDEYHNPSSELMSYYGSHDTAVKLRCQTRWSEYIKQAVWTCIVTEKIRKQMQLLYRLGMNERADLLKGYIDEFVYNKKYNIFEREQKHEVLKIFESTVTVNGQVQYLPNAITLYCRSVFEALNENNPDVIKAYEVDM